MDLRGQFKECKRRNEQQLLDIRKLESQIAHVKQQIENTKKAALYSKQRENQYKQILQHHELLKQHLYQEIPDQISTKTRPSFTAKHDLTQLLAITPDLICKKIELMIQQRINNKEVFSSQELEHINQLIGRLPKVQVGQFVSDLVKQLNEEVQAIHVPEKLYEYRPNIEDQQRVIEYHSNQKQKAEELAQKRDQLESETREAEIQLVRRVRELYADPAVQSALVKNIRVKAANHQVNVELQSTIQGANDIHKRIQVVQQSSNAQNVKNQIEVLMNDISQKQNQVASLIQANNAFYDTQKNLETESNKHKCQLLIDRVKAVKLKVEKMDSAGPDVQEIDKNAALLDDIKSTISPHTSISDTRAIQEIMNIIKSANELSKDSVVDVCLDIRNTLEGLVEKWGSLLEKQNIPITRDIPEYHDGIDNVIQAVDALREYVKENEKLYILEQEEKLKAKLTLADKVDDEMKQVQDALNERELIKEIGIDYTIQEKAFNEWLLELQVKD